MRKRGTILGAIGAALAALALVATGVAAAATAKKADDSLTGAGSSFVAPLVSQWIAEWGGKAGVTVTYGAIGSGGGIAAITARTVDFGASDAPLTPDQLKACNGCAQIPWALSATSIAYNLPGVPNNLHVTGAVLAGIYLGKIKKWDDPKIASLNPKVKLPSTDITPVYRSDGSGTSFNFTDYLSVISSEWKSKIGTSTQPAFPTGVGARGSSGVTGVVSRTEGSLTYVDVAYALKNKLHFMAVQNAAGAFATPGLRGITAAAKTVASVPLDNAISIVNPPKGDRIAYPICTFTYVIVPLRSAKAPLLRKFIFYAVGVGQQKGPVLLFAPLPKPVLVAAEKTIAKIKPA